MGGGYLNNKKITPKKSLVIGVLVGGIVFGSIGVVAATYFSANEVSYTPSDENWNVSTVQDAIDDLYEQVNSGVIKMTLDSGTTECGINQPTSSNINLTFVMPYTGNFTVKYGNVVNYGASSTSVTADGVSLGTFSTVNKSYTFSAQEGQTIKCVQSGAWYSGNKCFSGNITVTLDSTLE